jgi:glycosyltransferase involved in cell wall biosynthesis
MKKIFHLITDLNVGGAELMLYRLLSRMDQDAFTSQVVSMTSIGGIGKAISDLGIPVRALGMHRGRPSIVALMRLIRWLRQDKPDLIQTWLYHADLMGLIAAKLAGNPSVVWNIRASDMDMSQYRPLSGWTVRVCARLSSLPKAVIVNSQAGMQYHTQIGYHPSRWVMIPNGIDTDKFKPDLQAVKSVRNELGLNLKTLLIGYVARFDPVKDHETFFRGAQTLFKIEPDVHFLLTGSGIELDNPAIARLIESQELRNQFHLLGQREDIPRLTAALDIGCSTSISEGFSNSIAEAMACGVPCVATNVGDSAQIVGETGKTFPVKDPGALVEAWLELIHIGREKRIQLGMSARRRIENHYNLTTTISAYHDFYNKLIGV